MIPYAILMLTIFWEDGRSLELRALEPTGQGVTFRTVSWRQEDFSLPIQKIHGSFLNDKRRVYEEITLRQFAILRREDLDDPQMETVGWELSTEDPGFHAKLQQVLGNYMTYIHEHLEPMDYPPGGLGDVELALALNQSDLWKAFAVRPLDSFFAFYWEQNRLRNHFITKQKVTHIYIGNPFCYHLFPDEALLDVMLEKCLQQQLIPVIVLSSMPEFRIASYQRLLKHLDAWCRQQTQTLELVINDFGLAFLLQEMDQTKQILGEHFSLTLGVLLNKRKKDPRMFRDGERESSIHAAFYREYLKQHLKVEKISFEVGPCETAYGDGFQILHLPLYQTNTAGFCTLYALCRYGDRGRQEVVSSCPRYCETHHPEYPENLNIISRYNSLFGESMKELNDLEYLRALTRKNIQRLVVRR